MIVKELKELIDNLPDNAVIASWGEDDTRINSEIEEIDYLYTVNVNDTPYIILG